jgi:hypothetical protein
MAALTIGIVMAWPAGALAQSASSLPGRLETAVGGRLIASTGLGSADATLTESAGEAFKLFSTSSRMDVARALEVRFGVSATGRLQLEAVASLGTSSVRTSIRSDAERIPDTSATESVKELTVGGAVVWRLARPDIVRRAMPLVWAGGGYLGHLHEERRLLESGAIFQVGAGLDLVLTRRPQSGLKAVGVRIDGRGIVRIGGAATDTRARIAPGAAASLFVRF